MVLTALEYIYANCIDHLSVDQVASAVFVARRTLEKHFKQAIGHSVYTALD